MKTIISTLLLTIIFISQISAQITFRVTANKSSYSYGELIELKATLTNNTDSSLSLYGSSTCFMTLGFNSIVFSTPCTADYNDFSMPPGSSRTWIWKLDPAALGIPDKDGSQTIRCRCIGTKDLHFNPTTFFMQDSVIVKAPRYYGGKIAVTIKPLTPKAEIQRLRDSLNASVLKSYSLSDSTVIESWQVVNHSIDSIAQSYSKDYRLLSIAAERALLRSGISDTITTLPSATYLYRLKAFTNFTCSEYSNTASVNSLTGVHKMIKVPEEFSLYQNYPNPFNPTTIISYTIPEKSYVTLKVYDMLGSEAAELVKNEHSAGEYKVQFDAASLPSGIYIYTIQAGQYKASRKLLFLK